MAAVCAGSAVRGFNAATAMRPWRTVRYSVNQLTPTQLQCGHGHEAVENRATGMG